VETHRRLAELGRSHDYASITSVRDVDSELPAAWRKKDLQFVLHVPVVLGTPGLPRALAIHVR